MRGLVGWGLPGIVCVILGGLLFSAARTASDVEAARPNLKSAPGVVTASGSREVEWHDRDAKARVERERRESVGDREARRERELEVSRDVEIVHTTWIRYTFTVDGYTYEGDRYSFGGPASFATKAAADEFLAMHSAKAAVTVYYDPSDRAHCALVPGSGGWGGSGPTSLAVLFLMVGFALCGLAVRSVRPPKLPPPAPDPEQVAEQEAERARIAQIGVLGPSMAGVAPSPSPRADSPAAGSPPVVGFVPVSKAAPIDRNTLVLAASGVALVLSLIYYVAVKRPANLKEEAATRSVEVSAKAFVDAVRAGDAERLASMLPPGAFDPEGDASAPAWAKGLKPANSIEVGVVTLGQNGDDARVNLHLDLDGTRRYLVVLEVQRTGADWRVVGKSD